MFIIIIYKDACEAIQNCWLSPYHPPYYVSPWVRPSRYTHFRYEAGYRQTLWPGPHCRTSEGAWRRNLCTASYKLLLSHMRSRRGQYRLSQACVCQNADAPPSRFRTSSYFLHDSPNHSSTHDDSPESPTSSRRAKKQMLQPERRTHLSQTCYGNKFYIKGQT